MPSPAGLWAPASAPEPIVPPLGDGWWRYFDEHRWLDQPPQSRSWTCSACSIDWVAHATDLEPDSNREYIVGRLGYPSCINENVGLADSACAIRVMERWGVEVRQEWVSWDRATELCRITTGLLNSTRWQHFVAVRGETIDGQLWVANSARGWMGIYDTISWSQWQQWAGSWQMIYLVP